MPRRIEVTQEHIDEGIQRDSSHCMFAEAIKDTIPGIKRVSVDLATIRYTLKGKRYVFLTPRPAQVALLKFDHGEKLVPFNMRLGTPAQVTKNKERSKGVSGKGNTRRGGKTPPMGPLAGGSVPTPTDRDSLRTGRIRRYGLKAITE